MYEILLRTSHYGKSDCERVMDEEKIKVDVGFDERDVRIQCS